MDRGTQIRTVLMILSWINMYLARKGMSPIPVNEEEIGLILMIGTSIWAWWKNNNFTKNAQQAQEFKDKLDKGEVEFKGAEVVKEKSDIEVDNTNLKHAPEDDETIYPTGERMN